MVKVIINECIELNVYLVMKHKELMMKAIEQGLGI